MIFELLNRKHTIVYFIKGKKGIIAFPKENYYLVMSDGTEKSKELIKFKLGQK